mmetsp:Transcript_9782/g.5106  ORF Transcript_9782/g.5106 Transcript_9782/m.5106 type:complete len:240 (+) Transcript_9782:50-769(+)
MDKPKKAVVLSSGGLDSTTVMAIAKQNGYDIYSLSFFYGQRHYCELEAAKKSAEIYGVRKHLVLNIDLGKIGGSALTDFDIDVPKNEVDYNKSNKIPITYVPARNTIFLSYALAWAEVLKAYDIFIGVSAVDYSGYPDCRLQYIKSFEKMANLATKELMESKTKLTIRTPLINLSKAETILKGVELGVDYSITHSCYDPCLDDLACGFCESCNLRKKGFEEAGIPDPIQYFSYQNDNDI